MKNAKRYTVLVKDVMRAMEDIAPARLAVPHDPVGLQSGAPGRSVARLLLALEATPEVLASARAGTMVITHHPRFYRGLPDIRDDRFLGALAGAALKKGVSLFAAHTNLDIAPDGVNDRLAALCGLRADGALAVMETVHRLPYYKLTVFVPVTHWEETARAVCAAGAGQVGDYSDCLYRVAGTGSFRPGARARPFIGVRGKTAEVAEYRLEALVPPRCRAAVEKALLTAHPYEEPAYDFIPLERTENLGLGRVGSLTRPLTLGAYARKVKKTLNSPGTLCSGDADWRVSRVAVWSGAGLDLATALRARADAVVCGELDHHSAEVLYHNRVGVIAVGHGASERHIVPVLASKLKAEFPELEISAVPADAHYFRNV